METAENPVGETVTALVHPTELRWRLEAFSWASPVPCAAVTKSFAPAPAASAPNAARARAAAEDEPPRVQLQYLSSRSSPFGSAKPDAPDWTCDHAWLEFVSRFSF